MVGLAGNARLHEQASMWMAWAKAAYEHTGEKQRLFAELRYGARSWGKPRRVIARLEHGRPKGRKGGANPRYVVTNLQGRRARTLRWPVLPTRRDGEPHQGATA